MDFDYAQGFSSVSLANVNFDSTAELIPPKDPTPVADLPAPLEQPPESIKKPILVKDGKTGKMLVFNMSDQATVADLKDEVARSEHIDFKLKITALRKPLNDDAKLIDHFSTEYPFEYFIRAPSFIAVDIPSSNRQTMIKVSRLR